MFLAEHKNRKENGGLKKEHTSTSKNRIRLDPLIPAIAVPPHGNRGCPFFKKPPDRQHMYLKQSELFLVMRFSFVGAGTTRVPQEYRFGCADLFIDAYFSFYFSGQLDLRIFLNTNPYQ